MRAIRIVEEFLDLFKDSNVDSEAKETEVAYYLPMKYIDTLEVILKDPFFSQYVQISEGRRTIVGPFLVEDTVEDDKKRVLRLQLVPEGLANTKITYKVTLETI